MEQVAAGVAEIGGHGAQLGARDGRVAALTRTLGALLFEVAPPDPLTFALVPALFAAIVLVASLAPAERAARIDPVKALQAVE